MAPSREQQADHTRAQTGLKSGLITLLAGKAGPHEPGLGLCRRLVLTHWKCAFERQSA